MRRFLSWLAALPSRAFVYLMESFVSSNSGDGPTISLLNPAATDQHIRC